jgi:hypothetical protein
MESEVYYILKVKGQAEHLGYIQIRDKNLALLANLRFSQPNDKLIKFAEKFSKPNEILAFIETAPFGKLVKLEPK